MDEKVTVTKKENRVKQFIKTYGEPIITGFIIGGGILAAGIVGFKGGVRFQKEIGNMGTTMIYCRNPEIKKLVTDATKEIIELQQY